MGCKMSQKITMVGNCLGDDGYSSHVRGLTLGLDSAGADVCVETSLPPLFDRHPNANDKLITILKKDWNYRKGTTVMVAVPSFWKFKTADRPEKFAGFLVWEGDKIPNTWVKDCNDSRVDWVLVPSNHTKQAAVRAGVDEKKVFIVPHGVDTDIFKPVPAGDKFKHLLAPEKCTFLFNKGWVYGENDRSGFDLLARAFNAEFGKDEPVRLLAHINQAYKPQQGWDFGVEYAKLGLKKEKGQVVHIGSNVAYKHLPELYSLGNFVVSASKGEAFNLTILEGMACGLVPIVPNNGGEIDFVSENEGYVYHVGETIPAFTGSNGGYIYEETKWRKPGIEELRKVLRKAFNDWKENKLETKRNLCLKKAQDYTWKKSGERLLQVVGGQK